MTRRKRGGRGRGPRWNAQEEWPGTYVDEDWPNLVDMVLSWSLEDVMDDGLFKNEVILYRCSHWFPRSVLCVLVALCSFRFSSIWLIMYLVLYEAMRGTSTILIVLIFPPCSYFL
jgi:hypothetical protein